MSKKGFFVVIEGMDGTGKTFLTKKIEKKLNEKKHQVIITREPGGEKIAEKIRKLIFSAEGDQLSARTETLLFLASRANNVEKVIRPNLEKGKIVLCDRYTLSTIIYQGIIKQKEVLSELREIVKYAVNKTTPDLTIYMDAKAEEAFKRRNNNKNTNKKKFLYFNGLASLKPNSKNKNNNRYDKESMKFYKQIEKAYKDEMKLFAKKNRVLKLNSTLDLEILAEKAVKEIEKQIKDKW